MLSIDWPFSRLSREHLHRFGINPSYFSLWLSYWVATMNSEIGKAESTSTMRVLLTRAQYAAIHSLRPYADHIAVLVQTKRAIDHLLPAPASYSRHVDSRIRLSSPAKDWQSGRIHESNTKREEEYVASLVDICARERIDVILPVNDPDVYILSKNKSRLSEHGVAVLVPEFSTTRILLDKYDMVRFAEGCGFPTPRTFKPRDAGDFAALFNDLPPPYVVRPRQSQHAYGFEIVATQDELPARYEAASRRFKDPIIQEYIPGREKQNFYAVVGSDGKIVHISCPRIVRYHNRIFQNSSASCVSSLQHPDLEKVINMVEQLSWSGCLTVQTKIDSRDGVAKLMEINPRISAHAFYMTEAGVNAPLLAVDCWRQTGLKAEELQEGVLFLEPFEDIFSLPLELADRIVFTIRTRLLKRAPIDTSNEPLPMLGTLRAYASDYFGHPNKAVEPVIGNFFSDPIPSFLLFLVSGAYSLKRLPKIGR